METKCRVITSETKAGIKVLDVKCAHEQGTVQKDPFETFPIGKLELTRKERLLRIPEFYIQDRACLFSVFGDEA